MSRASAWGIRGGSFAIGALAVLVAVPARAYFERPVRGARALAAGDASVAYATDAGAILSNVAALAGSGACAVALWRARTDLDALGEGLAAGAVPTRWGTVGLGWWGRSLAGVYRADRFTLAWAGDLARTSEDAALSVGLALDVYRVAVRQRFDASDVAVTPGAGVRLQPFSGIALGWQARNLSRPGIRLDGTATPVRRTQAWGAAWTWRDHAVVTFERRRDGDGLWRTHAGVDVHLAPVASLRAGVDAGQATFGLGVRRGAITVDVAVTADAATGPSAVFGVAWRGRRP